MLKQSNRGIVSRLNLHSWEDSLSKIQILSVLKNTETFEYKCKHKLWIEASEWTCGKIPSENKLYQLEKNTLIIAIQISITRGNGLRPVSDMQINVYLHGILSKRNWNVLQSTMKRGLLQTSLNTCVEGKKKKGIENSMVWIPKSSSWHPNIRAVENI